MKPDLKVVKDKPEPREPKEPLQCSICQSENWQYLDEHRDFQYWYDQSLRYKDPVGFKMCKECGFSTYDYIGNIKDIYDQQRNIIVANMTVTCNRKRRYHRIFLDERLEDIESVLDIGCAQGYLLDEIRNLYGTSLYLHGTEYSEAARNYAKNHYGIEVTEEIPDQKFDLISYYHVIEHIRHPDKELKKAIEHLSPGGYLYLAVPTWYDVLDEASGMTAQDFENLFHVNHINTWTEQGFKNLLHNARLKIVKEDTDIYGYTCLAQVQDPNEETPLIVKEDYRALVKNLVNQRKAIKLMNEKKYEESIKAYKNFPEVYIRWAMSRQEMKEFDRCIKIMNNAIEACTKSYKLVEHKATILLQWAETKTDKEYTNQIRESEDLFTESFEARGSESAAFFLGIIEGKYKGNYHKAAEWMKIVKDINPVRWAETMNFIGNFSSKGWQNV